MKYFICLFLVLTFYSESFAFIEIDGEGIGRDVAIYAAIRRAVEQACGVYIQSDTVVKESALIRDKIISRSSGYVKSYKIVSEKSLNGITYITIQADVDNKILKNDLEALSILRESNIVSNPRIKILPVRQNSRILDNAYYIVYSGIAEHLTDKKFRIVDSSSDISGDTEYIIYYDVDMNARHGLVNNKIKIIINAKLVDNNRSQTLTSKRIEKTANGITEEQAIKQAAYDGSVAITDQLVDVLQKHWMNMLNNGAIYTLSVKNIKNTSDISQLYNILNKLQLVNSAKEVLYESNEVVFEIIYKGRREQLDIDLLEATRAIGLKISKMNSDESKSVWSIL